MDSRNRLRQRIIRWFPSTENHQSPISILSPVAKLMKAIFSLIQSTEPSTTPPWFQDGPRNVDCVALDSHINTRRTKSKMSIHSCHNDYIGLIQSLRHDPRCYRVIINNITETKMNYEEMVKRVFQRKNYLWTSAYEITFSADIFAVWWRINK